MKKQSDVSNNMINIAEYNKNTKSNISILENATRPLVSVVIACYNSEEFLPDALRSVVEQTYDNLEVVLINNGSSGNTRKIFDEFSSLYTSLQWKYIEFEKNIGLFRAYYYGFDNAKGDFIASLDCDDAFSIDFIYQIVKTAMSEKADVVSAVYVDNYIDSHQYFHHPMDFMETRKFCWKKNDILRTYLNAHGGTMQWCTVWSKVYSRDLFLRARQYLKEMDYNIVCCADILLSIVLLSQSQKWVNTHNAFYYYARHAASDSQNVLGNIPKMNYILESTQRAFDYMEDFLVKIGRFDELFDSFSHFKEVYSSVTFQTGKDSVISNAERKNYLDYACKLWKVNKPTYVNEQDWFFSSRTSPFSNTLDNVLKTIRSTDFEIISFDVFDTLLERPFFRAWDTFEFLSYAYNKNKNSSKFINFAHYRAIAETNALTKKKISIPSCGSVNLREIYDELIVMEILDADEASHYMNLEIDLERRFCKPRSIGKYLFDFAQRCGKKIVCISDMYLSSDVIKSILEKNGFTGIYSLFVSSEERVCKSDGRLFKKALSKLNIDSRKICHIGDNFETDIAMANSLGINAIHVTSARDMFMGKNSTYYSGQSFPLIFGNEYDPFAPMDYLGTRCLMGVAANKTFNNPFATFNCESDFDSNPNIIGYYVLGTYVFSIAKWLLDRAREKGFSTIHFLARDGYVIKQAYDILAENSSKPAPKSNYLHVSRQAMMPLMINKKEDVFFLMRGMDILAYSPEKFLNQIKPIIPEDKYNNRCSILEEYEIQVDVNFANEGEWNKFLQVFLDKFYNKECIIAYREKMKPFFCSQIGVHDCTFDVGHSARTEMLLSELTGNPISIFYLHFNDEHALKQSHKIGGTLEAFHSETAKPWEWIVLEKLLCDTKESLASFEIHDDKLIYKFCKPDCDEDTRCMIDYVHAKAIELVTDFVKTFPEWETFEYRFTEKPFLYYFYHAKQFDKGILQNSRVSDKNSAFSNQWKVVEHWESSPFVEKMPVLDSRSFSRKILDRLLPHGTQRRVFIKRLYTKICKFKRNRGGDSSSTVQVKF